LLAACVPPPPRQRLLFDTSALPKATAQQTELQCAYEAHKAVINVLEEEIAVLRWRRLHILCMEAKGAVFKGTEYVPRS
jgi:hypothetical protein